MAPINLPSKSFKSRSLPSDLSKLLSSPATTFTRLRDIPSQTKLPLLSRTLRLLSRQTDSSIIPTTYGSINSGPSPGTIVGIVLGSVGGFLLLLWLLYTCLSFGTTGTSAYSESIIVARERRKSHRGSRSSRRSHSRRTSETVEVRRPPPMPMPMPMPAPPPPRVREPERVERIIVEESRETRREPSLDSSRGTDEVVVIEEHSPPRRKKSNRKREDTRDSGYRTVDPDSYGGVVGGRRKSSDRR